MDLASADLKVAAEKEYNVVMKKLLAEHNGGNGYYILAVLVTLVSVMTQLVSQAMMRAKNKNSLQPQQKQKPNWLMLILMPGIMLSFALTKHNSNHRIIETGAYNRPPGNFRQGGCFLSSLRGRARLILWQSQPKNHSSLLMLSIAPFSMRLTCA